MTGTKPINEWSVEEVGQWLVAIGLGGKVDVFATNAVSGDMLVELEEEDLKGDLTLTSLQIKKLKKALEFSKSLEDGSAGGGSNGEDAAKVKELVEELSKLKMDLSAAEEKNKGLEEELQKLKAPAEKSDPPPPPPTKPAPSQQQQQGPGRPVVAGAAGGAARGAVMGAVAGAIAGDAAQGAKIGAATGATGGALRGIGARRGRRRAFG